MMHAAGAFLGVDLIAALLRRLVSIIVFEVVGVILETIMMVEICCSSIETWIYTCCSKRMLLFIILCSLCSCFSVLVLAIEDHLFSFYEQCETATPFLISLFFIA